MEGGPSCFPQGFTCLVVLWIITINFCILTTGLSPSSVELSSSLRLHYLSFLCYVRNPIRVNSYGLASSPFARRYLGNRFFFLFLRVLRCFSSPGVPLHTYFIEYAVLEGCSSRFPHSEISGSKPICDSPKHIGAYPVLHRLLVPRHSPYALNNLTYFYDHQINLTIDR